MSTTSRSQAFIGAVDPPKYQKAQTAIMPKESEYKLPKKKSKPVKPEPRRKSEDDSDAVELCDIFRVLPYPNAAACAQFHMLGMKPPDFGQIFVSIAIGPDTGDLHALACVGKKIVPKDSNPVIEILNAFAVSDQAYVAICEAIRFVCGPFQNRASGLVMQFEGDINMLSLTEPVRVIGHKPFYEHVSPLQKVM